MREYRHGSRWAVWRWKHINPTKAEIPYLSRLHILQTPWFGIFMHRINAPDPNPDLHNHPVHFVSFILSGRYLEQRDNKYRWRRYINFISANSFHRIIAVDGTITTLVFASKRIHEWGFQTDIGFVPWQLYNQGGQQTS